MADEEEGPLQEFRSRMSNFAGEMIEFERKIRTMQEEVRGVHDELGIQLKNDLRKMQKEMRVMQEKMKAMQDEMGYKVESEMKSVQHGIKTMQEEIASSQGEIGHGLSDEMTKMHRRLSRLQEDMKSLHYETQSYMRDELKTLQDKMTVLEEELARKRDEDYDNVPEEDLPGDLPLEELVEEGQVGIGFDEYPMNSGDEMGLHMQTIMIDVQDEIGKKKVELELMQERMRALHSEVENNIGEEIRIMQGKIGSVQSEARKMLTDMGRFELTGRRDEIKWMHDEMKGFEKSSAKLQLEMRDIQDEMRVMVTTLEEMLYVIGEMQFKVVNLVYELRKNTSTNMLIKELDYLDSVSFQEEKKVEVGEGKEKTLTEHQYVPDEFVVKKKFSVNNETGSNETIFVGSELAGEDGSNNDNLKVKGEGVITYVSEHDIKKAPSKKTVEHNISHEGGLNLENIYQGPGELVGDSEEMLIRVPEESFNASLETIGGVSADRAEEVVVEGGNGAEDAVEPNMEMTGGMTEDDLRVVIQEEIRNIQGEMINLEDDMNTMQQDVKQTQDEVRYMQGEVENIRDEINNIQDEMITLLNKIGFKDYGTNVTSSSNSDTSSNVTEDALAYENDDLK